MTLHRFFNVRLIFTGPITYSATAKLWGIGNTAYRPEAFPLDLAAYFQLNYMSAIQGSLLSTTSDNRYMLCFENGTTGDRYVLDVTFEKCATTDAAIQELIEQAAAKLDATYLNYPGPNWLGIGFGYGKQLTELACSIEPTVVASGMRWALFLAGPPSQPDISVIDDAGRVASLMHQWHAPELSRNDCTTNGTLVFDRWYTHESGALLYMVFDYAHGIPADRVVYDLLADVRRILGPDSVAKPSRLNLRPTS